MNRLLLFCLLSIVSMVAQSQELHYVELGVNGLHCSACSFTVEKALTKLDGVGVVQMDLNERKGKVFFAENQSVPLPALAKAITDAGYSVRFLELHFKTEVDISDECQLLDYCLVAGTQSASSFQLIGQQYLPKKEWKQIKGEGVARACATCTTEQFLSNSTL